VADARHPCWKDITPSPHDIICWVGMPKQQKTRKPPHSPEPMKSCQDCPRRLCCWAGCKHPRPGREVTPMIRTFGENASSGFGPPRLGRDRAERSVRNPIRVSHPLSRDPESSSARGSGRLSSRSSSSARHSPVRDRLPLEEASAARRCIRASIAITAASPGPRGDADLLASRSAQACGSSSEG